MTKALIYDFDRGLASLGGDERIEEVFGFKPRRFIKSQSLHDTFDKLHEMYIKQTEDALGVCEEEWYRLRDGIAIDFEVLDSITAYQGQKKKDVKGDSDKLYLGDYGLIGDDMENLVMKYTRTENNVIMIGHIKEVEDSDMGMIRYIPALSGRMKNEIMRSFDVVAYTIVTKNQQTGKTTFQWQLIADERRSAKCRYEDVTKWAAKTGGLIDQDFSLLFAKIFDAGYKNAKILILGDSGTGKTYSIRTLKNVNIKRKEPEEK